MSRVAIDRTGRRPGRRGGGGRRGEAGSVSMMEMIMLAPLFLILFLFVVFCGRIVNAKGVVEGAARDAARAASIARSEPDSRAAASAAAGTDLSGMGSVQCDSSSTQASGWSSGQVEVTVSCTMRLGDLSMLGVPGFMTIRASHAAPVDRFRGTS